VKIQNPKRTILNAVDVETGEFINATQLNDYQFAKKFRKSVNDNEDVKSIICPECGKELSVGINRKNKDLETYFFFHRNNFSGCDLVNGKISKVEVEKLNQIYSSKETQTHKDLKKFIYSGLLKTEGVDKESVKIEKWFFQEGKLERRPDVFCIYKGKKLAFEAQVSVLSQRYMLERYNYYRKEQVFVIWIVKEFNFEKNRQFIKDIQYLNNYQNIFTIDTIGNGLCLSCHFPEPYSKHLEIKEKISVKTLSFDQLSFDSSYQVFYYNYPTELKKKELEISEEIEKRKSRLELFEQEQKLQKEIEIKKAEENWQNKWQKKTKKYAKLKFDNYFLPKHCNSYITPNEKFMVVFPENKITRDEILEIEGRNNMLLWVINAGKFMEDCELRSIESLKVMEKEINFNRKENNDFRNSLGKKIKELGSQKEMTEIELESLDKQISDKIKKAGNISKLREKLFLFLENKEHYFGDFDLKETISAKFKEKVTCLNNDETKTKKIFNDISEQIKKIDSLKEIIINGKTLKLILKIPDKNSVLGDMDNYTIVEKRTLYTLIPVVIEKSRVSYVFFRPNEYAFLYDFSKKLISLKDKLIEVNNEIKIIEEKKLEINQEMELVINGFLENELNNFNNERDAKNDELEKTIVDLDSLKDGLNSIFNDFKKDVENTKKEFKEMYYFTSPWELNKWKSTENHVLFDFNEGFIYKLVKENELKKIHYTDFIDKLGLVKSTKKKTVI